jgi:hypothetical protein
MRCYLPPMRSPRVLLALVLAGGMTYATGTVVASAGETAPAAFTPVTIKPGVSKPSVPTVEVYSPDGTISRVPVRTGAHFQSRTANAGGHASTLTAPLSKAEVAAAAGTDGTVTQLQNTGPAAQRYDIVFVGDGYRESEQELFHRQAATQWAAIQQREPFTSLNASFNVWLVNVVSQDSGADNETPGAVRNTALGATFWCNDIERLLCANADKAEEYARKAPGADQVAVLVNTSKYGGAGGTVATVAGGNASAVEILIHELGHSMAGLADEYTAPGTFTGAEPGEPNISKLTAAQMRTSGTKWAALLGQPAPSGGVVGTFEGAKYAEVGVFRPSENSIMRSLGREFDPVGTAAMRSAVLAKVS